MQKKRGYGVWKGMVCYFGSPEIVDYFYTSAVEIGNLISQFHINAVNYSSCLVRSMRNWKPVHVMWRTDLVAAVPTRAQCPKFDPPWEWIFGAGLAQTLLLSEIYVSCSYVVGSVDGAFRFFSQSCSEKIPQLLIPWGWSFSQGLMFFWRAQVMCCICNGLLL